MPESSSDRRPAALALAADPRLAPTRVPSHQRVLMLARPEAGALELVERPLKEMAADEALLRIVQAGICGSDLHIVKWNSWAAAAYRPPLALGHELCAEVIAAGPVASGLKAGDLVIAETHLACGHCRQCRLNRRHTCENLTVFSRLDRGGFADFAVVPAALLRKTPPGLSPEFACLSEPLGIAARAVIEGELAGKTMLVTGCGPIGLLVIAVARSMGAHRILASDLMPERLALALALGADVAIDAGRQRCVEACAGEPVDVAVDASGHGGAIADALATVATGGRLILTGMPEAPVALDLARHVLLREVSLSGLYGRRLDETWLAVERLWATPGFDLSPLITHRFALEDFEAAFACAASGKAGKVLLQPG